VPGRSLRGNGRRPFTRLATAGLFAHVFFELAAGVGMPLASVLGPRRAAGVRAAATCATFRSARTAPSTRDTLYALVNTAGLAAVIAHLTAWPTRRTRTGLPWLEDCEGLGRELMPAYNPILYLSAGAALVALLHENRTAPAHLGLLTVGLVPGLAASQHAEWRRLTEIADRHPAWWNRRLSSKRGGAPPRAV
jgi:hypothetical protein